MRAAGNGGLQREGAERLRHVFGELAGLSVRKAAEELNRRKIPIPLGKMGAQDAK